MNIVQVHTGRRHSPLFRTTRTPSMGPGHLYLCGRYTVVSWRMATAQRLKWQRLPAAALDRHVTKMHFASYVAKGLQKPPRGLFQT